MISPENAFVICPQVTVIFLNIGKEIGMTHFAWELLDFPSLVQAKIIVSRITLFQSRVLTCLVLEVIASMKTLLKNWIICM